MTKKTKTVVILEAKQTDPNNVFITASEGDDYYIRNVILSKVEDLQLFAEWIIEQTPNYTLLPDLTGKIKVDYTETEIDDPDNPGQKIKIKTVDEVTKT